jgi:hypothetical protein
VRQEGAGHQRIPRIELALAGAAERQMHRLVIQPLLDAATHFGSMQTVEAVEGDDDVELDVGV